MDDMAIGFVLYNPSVKVLDRIRICILNGYKVYVFDNTPATTFFRDELKQDESVNYYTLDVNVGLGVSISMITVNAFYDKFTYLLFFDQDTVFNLDTLLFITSFYKKNLENLESCVAVSFQENKFYTIVEPVELVINSGSLFVLDELKSIGWHDMSYFVDGVDYKFCLDASIKGRNIYKVGNVPGFDHSSEQDDVDYIVAGHKFRIRRYPIFRVKDYIKSLIRLCIVSIANFKLSFFLKFFKQLCVYVIIQLVSRILKLGR
mgnify:FL=1|jgi:hypothetical protein